MKTTDETKKLIFGKLKKTWKSLHPLLVANRKADANTTKLSATLLFHMGQQKR